jgi:anti-sigma factor RsiW
MKWTRCRRRKEASLLAAGALGEAEKIELEQHMAACQECRSYYAEIMALTAPMAGWEKSFSTIEATPAARTRWAQAVRTADRQPKPPLLENTWRFVWHELIRPSRYAWTGMAALWVMMLIVNARLSDHQAIVGQSASARNMIQVWNEQKRVLAELIRPDFTAPAPPADVPRPRSQGHTDSAII